MNGTIFNTRNDMFNSFKKGLIIAELGVFEGEFSKIIFNQCLPKQLLLVDLFAGDFGSGDKDGKNHHNVDLQAEVLKISSYFQHNDNVQVIKASTLDFLQKLQANYLDIVYIDADHTEQAFREDLYLSYEKVKFGGIIAGHDYNRYSAIEMVVNQFCREKNLRISMLTRDGCPSFGIIKQ